VTDENRRANIAAELEGVASRRGNRGCQRGRRRFDTAVNRLYYAAFHATVAVCLTEGLEPKTHRGARHPLNVHFVLTGRIEEWVNGALARLKEDRYLADYQAGFHIDRSRYELRREEAGRLLERLTAYLRDNCWT
jgi:uncharacterized protein